MRQRAITAVVFVIVMLGSVFAGLYPFLALFGLVTVFSTWELMGLLLDKEADHLVQRKVLACVLTLGVYTVGIVRVLNPDWSISPLAVAAGLGGVFSLILLSELLFSASRPFQQAGAYLTAIIYTGLPFVFLADIALKSGTYLPMTVLGLLLLNWSNDTMAYVIGSQIGKTPFSPRISPKKTWEGTLGGVVCTFLAGWLLSRLIPVFTLEQWMGLSAIVAVFGTLGDLVESMLKRSASIKDSGSIMPGHGGFLDRFDSFILVLPFAWIWLA